MEYRTYRQRCRDLGAELESLKSQPGTHEGTVQYCLQTAETLLKAASVLIGMREDKASEESEQPK